MSPEDDCVLNIPADIGHRVGQSDHTAFKRHGSQSQGTDSALWRRFFYPDLRNSGLVRVQGIGYGFPRHDRGYRPGSAG